MIIKKSKKTDDNSGKKADSTNKKLEQDKPEKNLEESFQVIQERQERRRGDRRRGYRRIDDRNIISRAHEEANSIKERAAKEGFEYGLSQSKEELKKFGHSLDDFLNAKEKALEEVSSEIAFIAVKVAEKIIKTEVACDETLVLNIVSETLKEIGKDESSVIIKVYPDNAQIIRENLPKLFPYGKANARITVMESNEVDSGSCIVETNNGMVDARFSTQLQILIKAFEAGL